MRGSHTLFRIFGIEIKIHFSWWFIFILLTLSLSTAFFPQAFPGQSRPVYWLMGITAALLLFVSVLLHELSHSLVAKVKKIKVESITLFFFGGVARIEDEDLKPGAELPMALAGPLFSLLLAGIFYLIHALNGNVIVSAITAYLYQINFILAAFNLLPGFPLDGGRAFRAVLVLYLKDVRKATYAAAQGGKLVAVMLILLGIAGFFLPIGGGLWFILLGGFLYFLAKVSYEQVIVKQALSVIPVAQLITVKFPILPADLKFIDFAKKYSSSEQDAFLVKGKNYVGILDIQRVEAISKSLQEVTPLEQVAIPLSSIKTLTPKDTAYTAFKYFNEYNVGLLPVIESGKIKGVVARKAVMYRLVWGMKYGMKYGVKYGAKQGNP